MAISEIITLVSVLGNLIAIGIGGYKIYVDHKERRSHFRQALYAKQVEAVTKSFKPPPTFIKPHVFGISRYSRKKKPRQP
jgi:hypothetical protein